MKIHIQNFQSIADLKIDVSNFTVIRGGNHIGKSALYRSVLSVFRNRAGEDFIRDGKPGAKVIVDWVDHKDTPHQVTWSKKRKSSSDYIWNGVPYFSIDRRVPDFAYEVGMDEINISGDKIDPHFSSQCDLAFLMHSSGSLITKFFSEVLHLGSISKSLVECSKDLKDINLDRKVVNKELDRLLVNLRDFESLDKLDANLTDINTENAFLEAEESRVKILEDYLNRVGQLKDISLTDKPTLPSIYNSISDETRRLGLLQSFLAIKLAKLKSRDYRKDILYLQFLLSSYQSVDYVPRDYSESFKNLETTLNTLKQLKHYLKKSESAVVLPKVGGLKKKLLYLNFISTTSEIHQTQDKLAMVEEKLKELEIKINSYKICPTCGKEI